MNNSCPGFYADALTASSPLRKYLALLPAGAAADVFHLHAESRFKFPQAFHQKRNLGASFPGCGETLLHIRSLKSHAVISLNSGGKGGRLLLPVVLLI
jgi:hypothetical protein